MDGDLVRVLPCGHVFHLPEIDSWLLRVKKLCPICKRDSKSSSEKYPRQGIQLITITSLLVTVPIPPTPPAPSLHNAPPSSPQVGMEASNEETAVLNDNVQADSEETPLLARNA